MEVQGGEGLKYWFNGKRGRTNLKNGKALGRKLGGFKVRFRYLNDYQHQFRIDLGGNDVILLKIFKEFVRVQVDVSQKDTRFYGSVGLMGSYPSSYLLARDNSTIMHDMNAFGQEWQVRQNERKLFHVDDGPQHPTTCTMPTETEDGRKRRLGEASISRGDAEVACARVAVINREACIFDVLATNDTDMAESY